jgi:hypothetical protein
VSMELDGIASKLDDMKERCGERMLQLEKTVIVTIESQNIVLATRITALEDTARQHGKAIDKLKEWRTLQVGALIVIGILVDWIIQKMPWKW